MRATNVIIRTFHSVPVLILFTITFIVLEYSASHFISIYTGESFAQKKISIYLYYLLYTFFCFFICPVILNFCIYHERLRNFGLVWPERKWLTFFLMVLAWIFLVPFLVYFSKRPEFQAFYVAKDYFLLMQVIFVPLYYISEEFFFRGFLFLLLWKKVRWHSFWITDVIFIAAHVFKPGLEILLCIPVSVILNGLTLCSRSIMPAYIVHMTLGIGMNFLVRGF